MQGISIMYLAYSDKPVFDCIYTHSGKKIKLEDIVRHTGMPERTVIRAIKRLIEAGKIRRSGGGRGNSKGFIYHVV